MNKTDAAKLWPIIQAFGEGKTIQFKSPTYDRWEDIHTSMTVGFGYAPEHYRIKPEPRVVYINKWSKKRYGHPTEEDARRAARGSEEKYEYIAKKFVEAE